MRQELAALLDPSAPQGWPLPAEDCRDPGQAGHGKPAPLPVPLSRPGGPRESSGTSSPAGCLSLWQHQAEASVWRPQALWVLAVSVNGAGIGLGGAPRPHGVRTPAPVTGSGCPQLGALPIRRLSLVSEPNDKTGKQPSGQQSHPDLRLPREQAGERRAPSPRRLAHPTALPLVWETEQRFPADETLVRPEVGKACVSPGLLSDSWVECWAPMPAARRGDGRPAGGRDAAVE